MAKRRKPPTTYDRMRKLAWEQRRADLADGRTGPRAWTQDNGRAARSKDACRGKHRPDGGD